MVSHWFSEIILDRISLILGFSLNYSKLIKYSFFVVFNLYDFGYWFVTINGLEFSSNNYGSLILVIIGSCSFQLDLSFLGLSLILTMSFRVITLYFCIFWYQSLNLKSSFFYLSLNLVLFMFWFSLKIVKP
jgi:hypothetical protein